MRVIVVDDERYVLHDTIHELKALSTVTVVGGFSDAYEALAFVENHAVDIAFLDIEMYGMNGLELAKAIRTVSSNTYIIFLTGFRKYATGAFEVRANGYVIKPAMKDRLLAEIEYIKSLMPQPKGRIYIQTFGHFEVFCDGLPMHFHYTKSKELLAYLIDRQGVSVTTRELFSILWEEGDAPKYQSALRNLIRDLISCLNQAGAKHVIVRRYNRVAVNVNAVDCDYYHFLKGDVGAINTFRGEYMTQHSWAEFTTGRLHFD